jgi:hypothetical protein
MTLPVGDDAASGQVSMSLRKRMALSATRPVSCARFFGKVWASLSERRQNRGRGHVYFALTPTP